MKNKITKLLSTKKAEREELNKSFNTYVGYGKMRDFSDKMDKLETEIDLLETLLNK